MKEEIILRRAKVFFTSGVADLDAPHFEVAKSEVRRCHSLCCYITPNDELDSSVLIKVASVSVNICQSWHVF